jgi:hypothetical protein
MENILCCFLDWGLFINGGFYLVEIRENWPFHWLAKEYRKMGINGAIYGQSLNLIFGKTNGPFKQKIYKVWLLSRIGWKPVIFYNFFMCNFE